MKTWLLPVNMAATINAGTPTSDTDDEKNLRATFKDRILEGLKTLERCQHSCHLRSICPSVTLSHRTLLQISVFAIEGDHFPLWSASSLHHVSGTNTATRFPARSTGPLFRSLFHTMARYNVIQYPTAQKIAVVTTYVRTMYACMFLCMYVYMCVCRYVCIIYVCM